MPALSLIQLALRGLVHHWRSHAVAAAATALCASILIGALAVGDSVDATLRRQALGRLGKVDVALQSGDRCFRSQLADDLAEELAGTKRIEAGTRVPKAAGAPVVAPVLSLDAVAARPDGSGSTAGVKVLGVDERFWSLAASPVRPPSLHGPQVLVNRFLADWLALRVGQRIVLRVHKPALLPLDSTLLASHDAADALNGVVVGVVDDSQMGRFGLQNSNRHAPLAYVSLDALGHHLGLPGKANLLLAGGAGDEASLSRLQRALERRFQLEDAQLLLRRTPQHLELLSENVFLSDRAVAAASQASPEASPLFGYFATRLDANGRSTPYSFVAAAPSARVQSCEVLVGSWLAKDLSLAPGQPLTMRYLVAGPGGRLLERSRTFKVARVVETADLAADPSLVPEFPGLTDVDNCRDWKAGDVIDVERVRPEDEQYWKEFRKTPKALVTYAAAREMWSGRHGSATGVRFSDGQDEAALRKAIRSRLRASDAGLVFAPVRQQALAATRQTMDFGQLFLGFSLVLLVASVLLAAMVYSLSIRARLGEAGVLLAVGLSPARVGGLLLGEAAVAGIAGVAAGVPLAWLYARLLTHGTGTIWADGFGGGLDLAISGPSVAVGCGVTLLTTLLTAGAILRRCLRERPVTLMAGQLGMLSSTPQSKRPHEAGATLKRSEAKLGGAMAAGDVGIQSARGRSQYYSLAAAVAGGSLAMLPAGGASAAAGKFFGAGALMLLAGVLAVHWLLARAGRAVKKNRPPQGLSLPTLAWRGATRARRRSLATVCLIACACFLVLSVAAQKHSGAGPLERSGPSGGFAAVAESSMPMAMDLNSPAVRDKLNLPRGQEQFSVVPMRLIEGDQADCQSLSCPARPPLLGVDAQDLARRGAFRFVEPELPAADGWRLLDTPQAADELPAIADRNTITWALGRKVGDRLDYTDENGQTFHLRLVGMVDNGLLQGKVLVSRPLLERRFPSVGGYRFFLIDPGDGRQGDDGLGQLSASLADRGLVVTTSHQRLAELAQVENTYLSVFGVLGYFGVLLGMVGLALLLTRNVLERRRELAILEAVGLSRGQVRWLLVMEHCSLLLAGLAIGGASALLAAWPAIHSGAAGLSVGSVATASALVLLSGAFWTALAAWACTRGRGGEALRME